MRAAARARIVREHVYLKTILAEHYKIGLEFKPGDDPRLLDNPKQAWIIVLGKPEIPEIQMVQANAQAVLS